MDFEKRLDEVFTLQEERRPVIRSVSYSPAAIRIQFPNGDLWEYVVYDDVQLDNILRKYRRNMGKLVSVLRKHFEARKL